jgi:hypothetical protein
MCACGETTRLLQPSLAIQQFVQQCFLNLTINCIIDMTDNRWSEWSWRQQFRLWQELLPWNWVRRMPATTTRRLTRCRASQSLSINQADIQRVPQQRLPMFECFAQLSGAGARS